MPKTPKKPLGEGYWTKREIDLVEELLKAQGVYHNPLKHAADVVRMHYTTARGVLFRIRNKNDKMRESLEIYSNWRRRLKGRRYL